MEAKQALFAGLFAGDADEIPFEALNTGGFLDTMRELVGDGEASGGRKPPDAEKTAVPSREGRSEVSGGLRPPLAPDTSLWHGVTQIVEGACAVIADPAAGGSVPPEIRDRLRAALRSVAAILDANSSN